MTQRKTIVMDGDMIEQIESQLTYGDSFSGWITDAAESKLETQEN